VQAGAEGKPADSQGAADATAQAAAPVATAKAAEPADYTFAAPEGFELNEARLGEFKTIAKDLKLPQDSAQKLVDFAAKSEKERFDAYTKQVTGWADAVKADKDIGGDKLQESAAIARKAIDLGPPELKEFLNASGLGNHPALFKWAHAVGKALSEDSVVKGTPSAGTKSAAEILYGSTSQPKT
jgi:hypothetical protein